MLKQKKEDSKLKIVSTELVKIIAQASYDLWENNNFREIIKFDSLSQAEKDRIFNELEVSILGLFILQVDSDRKLSIFLDQKHTLLKFHKYLIIGFLDLYNNLNIEEIFIKQWKKLIDIRMEEYYKDFKLLLGESKSMKEFKKDDDEFKIIWARVETITLDCVSHIRLGKLDPQDPLIKFLQKWIVTFDTSFSKLCQKLFFKPIGHS